MKPEEWKNVNQSEPSNDTREAQKRRFPVNPENFHIERIEQLCDAKRMLEKDYKKIEDTGWFFQAKKDLEARKKACDPSISYGILSSMEDKRYLSQLVIYLKETPREIFDMVLDAVSFGFCLCMDSEKSYSEKDLFKTEN